MCEIRSLQSIDHDESWNDYQHFTVCCPWILYRSYFLKNGESERWNIKPKERCAIRPSLHQPDRPEQPHRGS